MFLDASDCSITPHLALDGFWEKSLTNVFLNTVKEGMRVVEVGANMGYYTLLAASKVGKDGRVFAFEPNPETFEILSRNIDVNGFLDSVTLINKAVFSKTAKLRFHKLRYHKGGSSVFGVSEQLTQLGERAEITEVEGISLDEYFADKDIKIDLMKVDAEGSEPCIFEGASKLLGGNPEMTIICEFYPSMIAQGGKDPAVFPCSIGKLGVSIKGHRLPDCKSIHG